MADSGIVRWTFADIGLVCGPKLAVPIRTSLPLDRSFRRCSAKCRPTAYHPNIEPFWIAKRAVIRGWQESTSLRSFQGHGRLSGTAIPSEQTVGMGRAAPALSTHTRFFLDAGSTSQSIALMLNEHLQLRPTTMADAKQ
jgi:hypothetical protein